ncbi:hypothetical protein [Burkholderia stagnalis]|uniref:hypothetical protein n=1 Tax=Burkholderia stagnalis TaxID=1503054 RepID=UPI000F80BC23|nr:hypothetical protein [Burkholderia stagnalis]
MQRNFEREIDFAGRDAWRQDLSGKKMMPKPVCQILTPEALDRALLSVVALLEGLDLSLTNPGNRKITTWNDEGDQKVTSEASIVRKVLASQVG